MTDERIVRLVETVGTRRTYEMDDGSIVERSGGSVSWRNNNPGNLKFEFAGSADQTVTSRRSREDALAAAQTRYQGVVALDQWGNAIFETYEAGRAAKLQLLERQHSERTIPEMLRSYSRPDYSGNTNHAAQAEAIYAEGDRQGVDLRNKKVGDMSQRELEALADGIRRFEGWRVGETREVRGPTRTPSEDRDSPQPARTGVTPAADPLADNMLQRNERGEAVRRLQQDLVTLGAQFKDNQGRTIAPTGFYGEQTETAVRDFQGRNNLPQTGIADEATRRAIETAARARTQPQPEVAPPAPAVPAPSAPTPAAPRTEGPQSFNDVMRIMLPPQNGVAPHMTSDFGPRTLNGRHDDHGGVDFNYVGGQNGVNLGHPTVHSPVSGVVVYGEGQGSYGTVKIRDDQGNMHEILHLDSRSVRVTDPPTRVEAGDPIGTMGGRGPNGADQYAQHVHYQMRDPNGRIIDPEAYWNNRTRTQGDATPAPRTAEQPAVPTAPPAAASPSATAPPTEVPAATTPAPTAPAPEAPAPTAPAPTAPAPTAPAPTAPAPTAPAAEAPATSAVPTATPRSEAMTDGVLRRNEQGPEVGQYQRILADLGYVGVDGKPIVVDEKFGPNTEFAARQFQRDHGIDQLGVIGPKTRAALDSAGSELLTHPDNPNNPLFKRMLEKVYAAEEERGIPHGEHSRKVAAALTVEAIREGIQPDKVELSKDGSLVRAVQFSTMGDRPELNRSTDPISTAQAAGQPIKESSEQATQVANNVAAQRRDQEFARQQSQPEIPATPVVGPR